MANWEELWPKRARKEKWRSITSQRRHNSWPMSQNAIRFSLNDAIKWFNLINIWPKPPSFLDKHQKGDVVSKQMQNISCQTQQSGRFTSRRFDYAPLNRQYQKIPGSSEKKIIVSSLQTTSPQNSGPFSRYFLENSILFILLISDIIGFFLLI